jgi:hypothetical protein
MPDLAISDCCGAEVDPETIEAWTYIDHWITCKTQPCSCTLEYMGVCPECDDVTPISRQLKQILEG